ncbi:MAG: hypothetical protein RRA92_01605 [Gemmatimonadota bacterium]|nr:hypothetical protein [Gemmatimonadota bacterium]
MSDEAVTAGPGAGAGTRIVRIVMPDRWLEHVAEVPGSARVGDVKAQALPVLLARAGDDPSDFFVEYAERRVPDEVRTLDEIGFRSGEMLAIRAYDLGHVRRFDG